MIRLFVTSPLAAGATVSLVGSQAHYLNDVMRVRIGSLITLFNGRDGAWQAEVASVTRGACHLVVLALQAAQRHEHGPSLLFSPVKKDATDLIAIKATELGVARLQPVFMERTAVSRVNVMRIRAQVAEAAEQCGRLSVPEVAEPVSLDVLMAGWPATSTLIVFDREHGDDLKAVVVAAVHAAGGVSAAVSAGLLVGPEGGVTGAEFGRLAALPSVAMARLGDLTLRAETAAIAAIACWNVLTGAWSAAKAIGTADQTDQ